METRALVAFALSMLVITLWMTLFSPAKSRTPELAQKRPAASEETAPSGRPAPTGTTEKPSSVEQFGELAKREEAKISREKTITVETPLYVAKLSSRGGKLVSWSLKHYRETVSRNSRLIDLVSASENGDVFPLALRVGDDMDPLINAIPFEFDKDSISLSNPQDSASLRGVGYLSTGYRVVKEMVFYGDRYVMDLSVSFCDAQGRSPTDRLGIVWPHAAAGKSTRWSGYAGPVTFAENKFSELKDIAKVKSSEMGIQWAGFAEKYFLSAIIPLDDGVKKLHVDEGEKAINMTVFENSERASPCFFNYQLYLGPKTIRDLKVANHHLDKSLDFGFFGILSKPLLLLLVAINRHAHNYGITIIVLTIIIKLLFWPLTHKSYASMKEMQRVQPRIKQIRERFKNDKEQLNREMMLLYKTHKVNPLGGCFPMLLQFPVFIALYKALLSSIEIRHAPFILWVKDLAAPDYLLKFPSGVSFFGIEGIGPLPLVMGASMLIQQRMTPTMGDPTQAKVMMLMPIFFTFLFISFPSGLVLYWLINNVLSIVQQVYIYSRLE